jgi:hypothetical protein
VKKTKRSAYTELLFRGKTAEMTGLKYIYSTAQYKPIKSQKKGAYK